MREVTEREYADASLLDTVIGGFIASAKQGEVVWLSEEGHAVAGVAPADVIHAGLRALGREK